ncbi:hypothetical protein [Afifella marina]|uniref:ABC-type glutathione transport system ATPase component, contains duplicated ATPase domain n=1 Tax=Afifella marina DSM 2698 TaxID=1120955 RepID=A0A1G5P560_AFIMA|nr:hypothetical protein [Afifella marina]MBK1625111.1 hypothetical protein [Afifella marina DSM 2698]MBK1627015.1 hypothetical protein [Afifella marina]MBK5919352.1 hypothetical protein [Afifella marina]RAI19579.1 hypothetical protein CH311_12290 [Afifella marina DSM 2698]SCZ44654.1 ABC-type glutathione transport system ATPase component, contains duplicated ATPase domain [Afifella marina DSM 2698]
MHLRIQAGTAEIAGHAFSVPQGIDFEAGEIVYLDAASGERPSLFLELLSGLARFSRYLQPVEGRAMVRRPFPVRGLDLFSYELSDGSRFKLTMSDEDCPAGRNFRLHRAQTIGFVFGEPKQYSVGRNVAEEIRYSFAALGREAPPDYAVFEKYGLTQILAHPTQSLSGGESHRLNIACVVETGSPFLILDLSAANLDRDFKTFLKGLLKEIRESRIVLIYDGGRGDFVDLCSRAVTISAARVEEVDLARVQAAFASRPTLLLTDTAGEGANPVLVAEGFCHAGLARPFSAVLGEGEHALFLAPNGTGKTSLARGLVGIGTGHRGRLWRREGSRIAATFQYPDRLPVHLTVGELDRGGVFRSHFPKVGRDVRVADLPLSRKKLLYVLAFLAMPLEILILDEPFAGLDRPEMEILLAQINAASGLSAMIFSHEAEIEAETVRHLL